MTKPQKYRDVARFLRSKGWELARVRGSHQIWQPKNQGTSIVVATHSGMVSAGIVRQIQAAFDDSPDSWD